MNFEISPKFFNPVYKPYLTDQTPLQIFFGGAGSGKSKFISQRVVLDMLAGRNYLVVMKEKTNIRDAVYSEILKSIHEFKLTKYFDCNTSPTQITCLLGGAQCLFRGLDDPEKLKSITVRNGVITDIWVEEATSVYEADIGQLDKRLRGESKHVKRMTLSFNPISDQHWLYKKHFKGVFTDNMREHRTDDILIVKTTHVDNQFLTEQDHKKLENEKDPYLHAVYTLGNFGSADIEGRVFTGFGDHCVVDNIVPTDYMYVFGGYDRGFSHRAGISIVGITYRLEYHVLISTGYDQVPFISPSQGFSILEEIKTYQKQFNCHGWYVSHEISEQISLLRKEGIPARSWLSGFADSKKLNDVIGDERSRTNQRLEFLNILMRESKLKIKSSEIELIEEIKYLLFKKLPDGGYNRNEVMRINDDVVDSLSFACGGYDLIRKQVLRELSKG